MDQASLIALLNRLRKEPVETEWLEFKVSHLDAQHLGEYLSALANSACVHGKPRGYLIFGFENKTREVVGTTFNPQQEKGKGNQDLMLWLSKGLQPNTGFECYEFETEERHVVLFEVIPALDRPVKFYDKAWIRIGSSKTLLANHSEKERIIWQRRVDWSGQICEKASPADLDIEAIQKARQEYKVKFPAKATEVDTWDDITFFNKIGIAIKESITNGTLLLLGKPESAALISPAVARITWVLKDEQNQEKDYEHFDPPFILNVDRVLARIRNLTIRQLPSGTLFPIEIRQYDSWVLREALHNCIAHQDYSLGGRINMVEMPDQLILTNVGSFLPGNVENVIKRDAPMEVYRNPSLSQAMVNLNMIDTQGGGIKRMFQTQMKRFFPLPDYNLSDPIRVVVTIRGTILNEQYTRMLMERTDLDLWAVILLDKIQKGIKIEHGEHARLKKLGLVEGRYPNLYISARVAAVTNQKARHIRQRGFDRQYYKDLIIELIRQHGPVSRKEIDALLIDKLPEALLPKQKDSMVHNLLMALRIEGIIRNAGTRQSPKWIIVK
ncbi:MAG: transcriptional regulator [Deltaproteobacteria bacterium]|nr:transcriptional regulator [Deltaproteobacteria bacterium]MBM4322662.1 transcriptional regulator [Deltaproteobacteria bacterium]